MEEVDAVDNGISQCDGEARYAVSSTLSARVAHLNPRWNSKSQDTEVRACDCACAIYSHEERHGNITGLCDVYGSAIIYLELLMVFVNVLILSITK